MSDLSEFELDVDDVYTLDGDDYNEPAGAGEVWVCTACGKRAQDRTNGGIDLGWDVSCFLNAKLAKEDSLRFDEFGRVNYMEEV